MSATENRAKKKTGLEADLVFPRQIKRYHETNYTQSFDFWARNVIDGYSEKGFIDAETVTESWLRDIESLDVSMQLGAHRISRIDFAESAWAAYQEHILVLQRTFSRWISREHLPTNFIELEWSLTEWGDRLYKSDVAKGTSVLFTIYRDEENNTVLLILGFHFR